MSMDAETIVDVTVNGGSPIDVSRAQVASPPQNPHSILHVSSRTPTPLTMRSGGGGREVVVGRTRHSDPTPAASRLGRSGAGKSPHTPLGVPRAARPPHTGSPLMYRVRSPARPRPPTPGRSPSYRAAASGAGRSGPMGDDDGERRNISPAKARGSRRSTTPARLYYSPSTPASRRRGGGSVGAAAAPRSPSSSSRATSPGPVVAARSRLRALVDDRASSSSIGSREGDVVDPPAIHEIAEADSVRLVPAPLSPARGRRQYATHGATRRVSSRHPRAGAGGVPPSARKVPPGLLRRNEAELAKAPPPRARRTRVAPRVAGIGAVSHRPTRSATPTGRRSGDGSSSSRLPPGMSMMRPNGRSVTPRRGGTGMGTETQRNTTAPVPTPRSRSAVRERPPRRDHLGRNTAATRSRGGGVAGGGGGTRSRVEPMRVPRVASLQGRSHTTSSRHRGGVAAGEDGGGAPPSPRSSRLTSRSVSDIRSPGAVGPGGRSRTPGRVPRGSGGREGSSTIRAPTKSSSLRGGRFSTRREAPRAPAKSLEPAGSRSASTPRLRPVGVGGRGFILGRKGRPDVAGLESSMKPAKPAANTRRSTSSLYSPGKTIQPLPPARSFDDGGGGTSGRRSKVGPTASAGWTRAHDAPPTAATNRGVSHDDTTDYTANNNRADEYGHNDVDRRGSGKNEQPARHDRRDSYGQDRSFEGGDGPASSFRDGNGASRTGMAVNDQGVEVTGPGHSKSPGMIAPDGFVESSPMGVAGAFGDNSFSSLPSSSTPEKMVFEGRSSQSYDADEISRGLQTEAAAPQRSWIGEGNGAGENVGNRGEPGRKETVERRSFVHLPALEDKDGSSGLNLEEPDTARQGNDYRYFINVVCRNPRLRTYFDLDVERIESLFDLHKDVGSGGYSTVHEATELRTGRRVAVKMVKLDVYHRHQTRMEAEAAVLGSVSHPNIVRFEGVVRTPTHFCFVMELLHGVELFDSIIEHQEGYDEREACHLLRQILSAVAHLHERRVVHRDIKPENFLFNGRGHHATETLKLIDFGFATFQDPKGDMFGSSCGTPDYIAPELLLERPHNRAVDLWSVGVVLYILLCGFPPFYAENDDELFDLISRGDYSFPSPQWDNVSASAKDLVANLLQINPALRLTAEEALNHPWVANTASPAQR